MDSIFDFDSRVTDCAACLDWPSAVESFADAPSVIVRFFARNLDSSLNAAFAVGLKMSVVEAWNLEMAIDLMWSAALLTFVSAAMGIASTSAACGVPNILDEPMLVVVCLFEQH